MAARKTFLFWGQSNTEGFANLDDLDVGTRFDHRGVYSNIYYWQPKVFDQSSLGGRWTQMDLSDPGLPLVPFGIFDEYKYYPHRSWPGASLLVSDQFGPDFTCLANLSGNFAEPIYAIKLGIPSTYFSRAEPSDTQELPFDWFYGNAMKSWHPGMPKSPSTIYTATVLVPETASTTIGLTTLTKTGAGWGVNAYLGKWVVSGNSSALIESNTSDTLTLANDGTLGWCSGVIPPTSGDTFRIEDRVPVGPYNRIEYESNTSTSTGLNSLTRSGATWTTNEHANRWVVTHGCQGLIQSNTATTLTIAFWLPIPGAKPPVGTYKIEERRFYGCSLMRTFIEDYCTTARDSAIAAGDTMDVQGVFAVVGESDSSDSNREDYAEENIRACINFVRSYLVENSMTSLPSNKIPFVFALVKETAVWPQASTVNAAFRKIAADDPYVTVRSTNEFSYGGFDGTDTFHFDAAGQIDLGEALYDGWKELRNRETSATTDAETRLTLSDFRTRVRRRYERNSTSTSLTNPQLDQFINDALRDFYNMCGDNCWFLRRIEQMTLSVSPNQVIAMPKQVRRVHRIERPNYPGMEIRWFGIGHDDSGRCQIVMPDASSGSYNIHYMIYPRDLASDADPCILPMEYTEVVVMLACKRAAESGGNSDMAVYYDREAARLMEPVKRDLLRYDRQRKAAFTVGDDRVDYGPQYMRNWEAGFRGY